MELLVFLALVLLGFIIGSWRERQHYADLKLRERKTRHLSVVNFGAKNDEVTAKAATLLVGSVVISPDYFKMVIASLISLIGGRVTVYETLLERARREALLRLKEKAIAWGATQVLNVRLETANINEASGQGIISIEVIAYGTAIR